MKLLFKVRIYNPVDIAERLTEKKPFFKMLSGGVYAVMKQYNKKGVLMPTAFYRVDKDRRPWRVVKKERQSARRATA